ncbi:MAG: F0F1 ATP synthase subunit gamma [Succinivibrio sp.]|jgi:F-type H+-transporting ATPase subunit gamma|nr:F0F1 ATP synthase subunit gamma [Succinivibrio sp.]MCI6449132.1 F0F1 ATP synthase subunit gamma [Succinivibrio sp.]MDY5734428.1 F0F1 ATP synthase subunit gamma [Succinivibrio sp.]MDY5904681.1 F0F1 ATP synthase subunit gamma [Succinivibrio sp.]
MAGAKEIRTKIASVKNTQKITSAMQMVAASKMRKAQEKMSQSRPYSKGLRNIIDHIASSHSEFHHPFMIKRDVKNVGFIVVSTDRGLCGGLNINLFRTVLLKMKEFSEQGIGIKVVLLGSKAAGYFNHSNIQVMAQHAGFGDDPQPDKLVGAIKVMTDAFLNGEVDEIYLSCNSFKNTMVQTPLVGKLLPLEPNKENESSKRHWDYLYEPEPESILKVVLDRYIMQMVYQAVLENLASEQAARMVAMKAATDNAEALVSDLQLEYNKARQAGITMELNDIVSGASAV